MANSIGEQCTNTGDIDSSIPNTKARSVRCNCSRNREMKTHQLKFINISFYPLPKIFNVTADVTDFHCTLSLLFVFLRGSFVPVQIHHTLTSWLKPDSADNSHCDFLHIHWTAWFYHSCGSK